MDIKSYIKNHEPDKLFSSEYEEKHGSRDDFAAAIGIKEAGDISRAKSVMKQGFNDLKLVLIKEERLLEIINSYEKTIKEKDRAFDSLVGQCAERVKR